MGNWFDLCGNMQVFETHSVAYEPLLSAVLFGNQDTGTITRTLGGSGNFDALISLGDGNACMMDCNLDANHFYF
jgi:hypothetical protein